MAKHVLGHQFFIPSPIPFILEAPKCSNSMLATGYQPNNEIAVAIAAEETWRLSNIFFTLHEYLLH